MKKATIFCASSELVSEQLRQETAAFTDFLNLNNIRILCGGGRGGLMKVLADQSIQNQAPIKGIMPTAMAINGWDNTEIKDFIYTDTIEERKNLLIREADIIIVLPGGTGTLEEFFDAVTLRKIGEIDTNIYLYNMQGYYDDLLRFIDHSYRQSITKKEDLTLWSVLSSLSEIKEKVAEIMVEKKTIS